MKSSSKFFAENLKYLRNKRNMEQMDLAIKLNRKSSSSVSEWEKGIHMPSIGTLSDIAEIFSVSITDLMKKDLSNITTTKPKNNITSFATSTYNYFESGLSANLLETLNPFTAEDVQQITLSDVIFGKNAGDPDLFLTHINTKSVNNTIPNKSLIAVKKAKSIKDLANGDIVLFRENDKISIKRFYNDEKNGVVSFLPDSKEKEFFPSTYRYEDLNDLDIIGKIITYIVEL